MHGDIGIFVKSMVEGGAAHVVRITNGESVILKYITPHCLCTGWQDPPWRPDTGSGQLQPGWMHAGRVSLLLCYAAVHNNDWSLYRP